MGLLNSLMLLFCSAQPHRPAKGASTIGTLVERTTRFVVLVHMPVRKADVADSLNAKPRKTLDYATPGEQFTNLLAGLAGAQKSPSGGVRPGT